MTRKFRATLSIGALLLTCGSAEASEWASLGKSKDGTKEAFVDVSSIRIAGEIRSGWGKFVFLPHTMKGVGAASNTWQSYVLSHDAFNCSEETFRTDVINIYFEDGTVDMCSGSALAGFPESSWTPVPPDSWREKQMRLVCEWTPK